MRYRGLWPEGEDILCLDCSTEFRWFVAKDRPRTWPDMGMGTSKFRLPCGHLSELFSDVVPLRGHPLGEFG